MTEPHAHDDSKWRLPELDWAPHGDQTVATRLFAAAAEQCDECMPGLTAQAAQNGDTLAITILLADTLLDQPVAARCAPAPALQEVLNRIRRMGNPDKTAVVGMLRTLTDAQRLDVAIACWRATQDYVAAVYEWAEAEALKRQSQPGGGAMDDHERVGPRGSRSQKVTNMDISANVDAEVAVLRGEGE